MSQPTAPFQARPGSPNASQTSRSPNPSLTPRSPPEPQRLWVRPCPEAPHAGHPLWARPVLLAGPLSAVDSPPREHEGSVLGQGTALDRICSLRF